ncbi:GNAT family N-acetyltransferase [Pararhodonellum marinum]|uniref:GNAT family N-acetyltransferase n=1 Tax=Pararhodonellum marinum TaxID=2755358 RepID=UPI00188DFBA2|nr:GNAT family N-acetyltransferase [Pararhodonellum marinum]
MILRKGSLEDLPEMQKLYVDSIRKSCKAEYNKQQIEAWSSGIENTSRWQDILKHQFVLVAQNEIGIIGFCTLDKGNHIDFLYVHRERQRHGIANQLYTEIEKEAKRQGQTQLTAEVSKTAKTFFEKVGFTVVEEQHVNLKGVDLTNYKMTKTI